MLLLLVARPDFPRFFCGFLRLHPPSLLTRCPGVPVFLSPPLTPDRGCFVCVAFPQAVKDDGRVAFVCKTGESRSPAVLIGCLMVIKKQPFEKTLEEVEEANEYIDLNDGFVEQLRMLSSGATEASVMEAVARREPAAKKQGKNKQEQMLRKGARSAKGRAGDD